MKRQAKKEKPRAMTNPNGANQYHLDPRQSLFLAYYLDPKSQSRGNATKSAILAGYEEKYAENIMSRMPTWLSAKVEEYRSTGLLSKAERNLEEMLDLPSKQQAMGAFGPLFDKVPTGKKKRVKGKLVPVVKRVPVMVYAGGLLKIKNDASQFIAKTVGRKTYGSEGEGAPPGSSIVHMTQIIINPPPKTV